MIKLSKAIVVEGRDDVDAVGKACDTLIIPTHGFGIREETWKLIEKAYRERGIIILTDPDFSGEEIRRKLTQRFPDAIQAYVLKEDAMDADDIGIENACPEVIEEALKKALRLSDTADEARRDDGKVYASMQDMISLGLAGVEGADKRREAVCAKLGIGYGNARSVLKKLKYWGIGITELEQAIKETI